MTCGMKSYIPSLFCEWGRARKKTKWRSECASSLFLAKSFPHFFSALLWEPPEVGLSLDHITSRFRMFIRAKRATTVRTIYLTCLGNSVPFGGMHRSIIFMHAVCPKRSFFFIAKKIVSRRIGTLFHPTFVVDRENLTQYLTLRNTHFPCVAVMIKDGRRQLKIHVCTFIKLTQKKASTRNVVLFDDTIFSIYLLEITSSKKPASFTGIRQN